MHPWLLRPKSIARAPHYCPAGQEKKGTTWQRVLLSGSTPTKGYGFISREDGDDLFVHYSRFRWTASRPWTRSQAVEFDITTGQNGKLQASNVRKL